MAMAILCALFNDQMKKMNPTVVLIGCGNMGYAMLSGWLRENPALRAHVMEPVAELRTRAGDTGAEVVADVSELGPDLKPDLVVLAVKPGMIEGVLAGCHRLAETGATFVSVAAGINIPRMAAALPDGAAIIRCMPNTPAAIGEGMLVLYAGEFAPENACDLTASLFSASGAVTWIEDESLMDAVTAISGSGPAYVFHFIEALTAAGEALGLPSATADLLARQTVAGAGRLAMESSTPPTTLREQVTSPGGTTAAALGVFMQDDQLMELVNQATHAARDRGVELGKA